MRRHGGGLLCCLTVLVFVLLAGGPLWALGPRYTLLGTGHVLEVESPNLMRVRLQGQDRVVSIRLLGVGSPRNRDRIRGLDPQVVSHIYRGDLWEFSRAYVRTMTEGRMVEVWTRKWDRLDDKNRLLAYVILPRSREEPLDVNAEIIRQGLGFVTRDYVHVTFTEYRTLEQEARKNRRGIWRSLPLDQISSLHGQSRP